MMDARKMFAGAVAAGALALVPALANAYTGPLLTCVPTIGTVAVVGFNPGLTCSEAFNKIAVEAMVDNCADGPSDAVWDGWAAAKVGSKITGADAGTISKTHVKLKGSTFGSCNFSGSSTSFTASAAGKVAMYLVDGVTKVKGGKGALFARIAGDTVTLSASALGTMTKGFGAGAKFNVQLAIDLGSPFNGELLGCNTGALCPPDLSGPATDLGLVTNASSYLEIYIGGEDDCTAAGVPYKCCGGAHPSGANITCQGQ